MYKNNTSIPNNKQMYSSITAAIIEMQYKHM